MANIILTPGQQMPHTTRLRLYRENSDGTYTPLYAPYGTTPVQGNVGVRLLDESGIAYGVPEVNGKPRVSSTPYLYDIAEGNVAGHSAWSVFGYTPAVGLTESDLWSAGGVYVFPAAAQQIEIVSSDNTQDIGTVIKGDDSRLRGWPDVHRDSDYPDRQSARAAGLDRYTDGFYPHERATLPGRGDTVGRW